LAGSTLLVAAAALIITVSSIATLRAVAPTAPANLAANVSGLNVTLTWGASANAPTQYILQAGFAPGQTAITVPLPGSQTFFNASAPAPTTSASSR
jgi:hypothetical protein